MTKPKEKKEKETAGPASKEKPTKSTGDSESKKSEAWRVFAPMSVHQAVPSAGWAFGSLQLVP